MSNRSTLACQRLGQPGREAPQFHEPAGDNSLAQQHRPELAADGTRLPPAVCARRGIVAYQPAEPVGLVPDRHQVSLQAGGNRSRPIFTEILDRFRKATQGRFLFGAGLAVSPETSLAEANGHRVADGPWTRFNLPRRLPAKRPRGRLDRLRGPSSRAAGPRPGRRAPRPGRPGCAG